MLGVGDIHGQATVASVASARASGRRMRTVERSLGAGFSVSRGSRPRLAAAAQPAYMRVGAGGSRLPEARLSNCLLIRNGHLAHHSSESETVRTGGRHGVCPSQVGELLSLPHEMVAAPFCVRAGEAGGGKYLVFLDLALFAAGMHASRLVLG